MLILLILPELVTQIADYFSRSNPHLRQIAIVLLAEHSSHLTYHCKRQTGMTPRQIANSKT